MAAISAAKIAASFLAAMSLSGTASSAQWSPRQSSIRAPAGPGGEWARAAAGGGRLRGQTEGKVGNAGISYATTDIARRVTHFFGLDRDGFETRSLAAYRPRLVLRLVIAALHNPARHHSCDKPGHSD